MNTAQKLAQRIKNNQQTEQVCQTFSSDHESSVAAFNARLNRLSDTEKSDIKDIITHLSQSQR